MKKFRKNIFSFFICIFCLSIIFSSTVSAVSFTHRDSADGNKYATYTRAAYDCKKVINASDLGLDIKWDGLSDVYCGDDGSVYLLCSTESQVIILNKDYTLRTCFSVIDSEGNTVKFKGAKGIYLDKSGNIRICDTSNGRILVVNYEGKLQYVMEAPKSNLIPDDFIYQPISIMTDDQEYTYILSMGCYYGILLYSPDEEFVGFYGANTVNATALDTLSYLWDMLTSNEEKKSQSAKKTPYSFIDFAFDENGYLVTCTSKNTEWGNGTGQIRKVAPNGSNILYKRNSDGSSTISSNFNFLERATIKRFGKSRIQSLVALDVSDSGYIYALDETYGLIYIYDSDCNLINAFGGGVGEGIQDGEFAAASSLALNGEDLLVVDSSNFTLTVFSITEYGKILFKAQAMYLAGDYLDAKSLWEQVLALDAGNQLAYKGLAMAYYNQGDYKTALEYAENGLDYKTYDLAYQTIFKDYVSQNFIWILIIAVIIVSFFVGFLIYKKNHKESRIKNFKIKTFISVPTHPFNSFATIKEKNAGSLTIAFVMLILYYIASTLRAVASGFLYTTQDPKSYNTLYTLAQTVGLILLWSVMNWLICTLFQGKGKLSEVFIDTTYSLLPLIVYTFVETILSHFLPLTMVDFMSTLSVVVIIYTMFLLSVSLMTAHEYSFLKFLGTAIVTLISMIIAVIIVFVVFILLQQFGNFISSIYMEIVYR